MDVRWWSEGPFGASVSMPSTVQLGLHVYLTTTSVNVSNNVSALSVRVCKKKQYKFNPFLFLFLFLCAQSDRLLIMNLSWLGS